MNTIVGTALVILAGIHLMPLLGVIGSDRLETIYGVQFTDPNTLLLMRHRAVLFGILGLFTLLAAFRIDLQWLALIMNGLSIGSFLTLAFVTPTYNAHLSRVVLVDLIGLIVLILAVAAMVWRER